MELIFNLFINKVVDARVTTNYTNALSSYSSTFMRPNEYTNDYYFHAIAVRIFSTGSYSFTSNSTFDTYGSFHHYPVDITIPSQSMIVYDDDNGFDRQFQINLDLKSDQTYVLIVTTYSSYITGWFSIIAEGPSYVQLIHYDNFVLESTTTTTISPIFTSTYSGFLSSDNLQFTRSTSNSNNHYYQPISSSFDIYGYIYENSFNPYYSNFNLIASDDDSNDNTQFRINITLQCQRKYILVITSFGYNITGAFLIKAIGPTPVNLTPINQIKSYYHGEGCGLKLKSYQNFDDIDSFLSTSLDREVAFMYADCARENPEVIAILFQLEIDPTIAKTSFASLDHVSYFSASESEILFSMHTIFRIHKLKQIEQRLWEVKLILTRDDDEQLKQLADYTRKSIEGGSKWEQLGYLMTQMTEFEQAEKVFTAVLYNLPSDNAVRKAAVQSNLGSIAQTIIPSDYRKEANIHSLLAIIYDKLQLNEEAIQHILKAINIGSSVFEASNLECDVSDTIKIFFYILFFIALLSPQRRTVTIQNITSTLFEELSLEHGETLSCPCSTITMTYNTFVTHNISSHPVCSSVFVSREWIEALYIEEASQYTVIDFRTTAKSQFDLLAALCTASKDAVSQAIQDVDNQELVTVQLLEVEDIQSQVKASVDFIFTMALSKVTSILNFLQVLYQSNTLVSSLNTNALVIFHDLTSLDNPPQILINSTYYLNIALNPNDTLYSSSCAYRNPTARAGFFPIPNPQDREIHATWFNIPLSWTPFALLMVDGFFGGCTPLDALLASTLDCLYKLGCLKILSAYFPRLNHTNYLWNKTLPPTERRNISVKDLINHLFIAERLTEVNYMDYFNQCDPSFCIYTTTDEINFSYTITLLISLYGGLTSILRFIAPFLINSVLIIKGRSSKININRKQCLAYICKLGKWTKQLNLFKSATNRTVDDIKQQRITTRLYLILFICFILTVIFYHSLKTQTITMVKYNPSLSTYKNLQTIHMNTLKCPCSNMAMPYKTFTSLSPTFHQICSSDLVGESWISFIIDIGTFHPENTWVIEAGRYFQMLLSLCQLIKQTVDEDIRRFLTQTFATSHVLIESDFDAQLNATIIQFTQSINISFSLLIDAMRTFMQIDQPLTTFTTGDYKQIVPTYFTNTNTNQDGNQTKFQLNTLLNDDLTSPICVCAIDTQCQRPLLIRNVDKLNILAQSSNNPLPSIGRYMPPGIFKRCFTTESLLVSTLECFFSGFDCMPVILYNLNQLDSSTKTPWINVHPLVYHKTSTRFISNASLSLILKEMMIEQWNSLFLFNNYYDACSPSYCTYSDTKYGKSFIEIIIALISMIGGLIVVLRLITPLLIKLIFRLLQPRVKNQQRERQKLFDQLKPKLKELIMFLFTKLKNLNLFPPWTFGSNADRTTAKHLSQLSTRVYLVILIISFVIITLYTIVQPQALTKTFINPTVDIYNSLIEKHGNQIQCPCSRISSEYKNYVTIKPIFHQICSSHFSSNEWRISLTKDLNFDLLLYEQRDYRRFLSAHLQFLTQLCQLSNQSVQYSIQQSISSLFITNQLLSKALFVSHIESMITKTKSNAPLTLARLLFLLRSVNRGNAFVSTYGTNFHYIIPSYNTFAKVVCYTKAVKYDNNCSCGLNTTCTVQASFIEANSSKAVSINGFKMGCTPSESFLASTLECFYNLSCINLIYKMTNYSSSSISNISNPLNTNLSRFPANIVVADLVNELFVETWSTIINYSSYFDLCSPILCSYTYEQQLDSFYTITYLLGLYGGLSLILKWICPKMIYLMTKIYQCRKNKRRHPVGPISNVQTTTSLKATPITPKHPIISFWTSLCYCGLGLVLFTLVAILFIISSVYYIQQKNKQTRTINDVSNITVNVTVPFYNVTNTIATQDESSPRIQSTYSSSLTYSSSMYCRADVCSGSVYHYQAIQINASTSGYYSISSWNNDMDTYGYLYNGTFDPLFPSQNLILQNDDGATNNQFGFGYFLQFTGTYIVVVTTVSQFEKGTFSLIAYGPGLIRYNQLNITGLPIVQSIYSSSLTYSSPMYCRADVCSGSVYYYQAIQINTSTSGNYSISSWNSDMDTYGYLYNGTFDPLFPSQNLILQNDDSDKYGDFGFAYFLQSTETYIVVVTTVYQFEKGTFSLIAYGPGLFRCNQLNMTVPIAKFFLVFTSPDARFFFIQGESAVESLPIVQSIYSSSLTYSSPMYCRVDVCSESVYYYQAIQINTSTSGNFSISSWNSDMDTYGYLYNGTFDPLFPSQNLILQNSNGAGRLDFKLTYFLQSTETYIVVVTTYYSGVIGPFLLIVVGPASTNYNQLNITGPPRIESTYSSALTYSSSMYCRADVCSGSPYYYQAIKINISINGLYNIASNSNMDTYGYLYNGTFDSLFPSQNLILQNDDGAANNQFGFGYFLQFTGTYIVVVTTYYKNITGPFLLIVNGGASATFNAE
ncbi:hypothetical protein I4U23_011098 [Adineta vaga]|nr:hypothetical protein I4U23_011098 [Adineta vaga]